MKMSRDNALFALLDTVMEQLSSDSSMTAHPSLVSSTFWSVCGQELQRRALEDGLRSGKRERRKGGRERGRGRREREGGREGGWEGKRQGKRGIERGGDRESEREEKDAGEERWKRKSGFVIIHY